MFSYSPVIKIWGISVKLMQKKLSKMIRKQTILLFFSFFARLRKFVTSFKSHIPVEKRIFFFVLIKYFSKGKFTASEDATLCISTYLFTSFAESRSNTDARKSIFLVLDPYNPCYLFIYCIVIYIVFLSYQNYNFKLMEKI